MIQIANTIISEDIVERDFVCNLNACKGACCIEGDAGAPIEERELNIMKRIYPEVSPYLTEEGKNICKRRRRRMGNPIDKWGRMCLCSTK